MKQVLIKNKTQNFGCTGSLEVVDASTGEIVCSITANGGTRQRDLSNSYDQHRVIKEGSFRALELTGHDIVGDVQGTIDSIKKHLPACFHESQFARPYQFESNDAWPVFDFFRALSCQGGWYGNTPKSLQAKIKRAWKSGVKFIVE